MKLNVLCLKLLCLLSFSIFGGCVSPGLSSSNGSPGATPEFFQRLGDVDVVRIEGLEISKQREVRRFIQVLRNAHWGSYLATVPSEVDTVELLDGERKCCSLLYVGGQFLYFGSDDSLLHGAVLQGTVHIDDDEWVQEQIDAKLHELENGSSGII